MPTQSGWATLKLLAPYFLTINVYKYSVILKTVRGRQGILYQSYPFLIGYFLQIRESIYELKSIQRSQENNLSFFFFFLFTFYVTGNNVRAGENNEELLAVGRRGCLQGVCGLTGCEKWWSSAFAHSSQTRCSSRGWWKVQIWTWDELEMLTHICCAYVLQDWMLGFHHFKTEGARAKVLRVMSNKH